MTKKQVLLNLEPEYGDILDHHKELTGISYTEFLKRAIKNYHKKLEHEQKIIQQVRAVQEDS